MFSAFNPSKCTHTWSSGQPTLQRPGSSWGFGAMLKGLTSFMPEPRFEPTTSGYKSDTLSIRATTAPWSVCVWVERDRKWTESLWEAISVLESSFQQLFLAYPFSERRCAHIQRELYPKVTADEFLTIGSPVTIFCLYEWTYARKIMTFPEWPLHCAGMTSGNWI